MRASTVDTFGKCGFGVLKPECQLNFGASSLESQCTGTGLPQCQLRYIENFDLMHLPGTSRQRLGALRNAISQCTEAQSRCTWQVHQVGLRYDIAQVPERHPKAPKSSSAWRCPWSLPLASVSNTLPTRTTVPYRLPVSSHQDP